MKRARVKLGQNLFMRKRRTSKGKQQRKIEQGGSKACEGENTHTNRNYLHDR